MGTAITPLPGMGNDVQGNQVNPMDLLRRIYMQQQPGPATQGQASIGPATPQPRTAHTPMPVQQGGGVTQGEFQTKGAHQRASMQSLATTLQNTVAQANNALVQHEQKVLSQKTDAYSHAVQGMAQADEMLKTDPTNIEAVQMKQRNGDFLKAFLDPTTPEGKKNIKMLTKAYGVQEGEKTPEQIAAQGSTKKVQEQAKLVSQAEGLRTGSAFPQTAGISPMSQVQAQMIKEGLQPKAATGTAILNNQEKAAQTMATQEQKQAELKLKQERLGLDPQGNPIPLENLPVATQAKIKSERATDELKQAQQQYAQARAQAIADPKSPQNQHALMLAGAMQKIATASMLRAQVGLLNYRMNATSSGEDGKTIPGAMEVNGQPIGKAYASQVGKTIATQAQFVELGGQVDQVDYRAKALADAGFALNDPRLVQLMSDKRFKAGDSTTFHNLLNSNVAATLPSEARDYLIAQKQLIESAGVLRSMVKGSVAQKQIDNAIATFPGAQTPNYEYAHNQLESTRGVLNRLEAGVPKVNIPSRTNQPGTSGGQVTPPDKLTNDLNKALTF